MRNARHIFGRDLKAIFVNPIAILVVIGLIALPALFAGFALSSMWDPYGNVSQLKIAVVNEDAGSTLPAELNVKADSSSPADSGSGAAGQATQATQPAQEAQAAQATQSSQAAQPAQQEEAVKPGAESGQGVSSEAPFDWDATFNLGASLVEAMAQNRTFDWCFVGYDEAWEGLESGEYYAVFVLPENLTSDFFSILTDKSTHPQVEYWVNQKNNAMALETSDAGAGAIDGMASSVFAEALGDAAAKMASGLTPELEQAGVISGDSVKSSMQAAQDELQQISKDLGSSDASIDSWRGSVSAAKSSLEQLSGQVPGLRGSLSGLDGVIADARAAAQALDSTASRETFNGTDWNLASAEEITQRVEQIAADIQNRQAEIFAATTRAEDALSEAKDLLEALETDHPADARIPDLKTKIAALQTEIQTLKELSATISQAAQRVQEVAVEVSDDLTSAAELLESLDYTYSESTYPQITISLDSISLMVKTLDSAVANIGAQADQASVLLGKLDDALGQTKTVLSSTSRTLSDATQSLETAQSNLQALANSDSLRKFTSLVDLDVRSYGDFTVSPAALELHPLFDLNALGSGLAPFYACLAMWIGCLMLIAFMRPEVDAATVPDMRLWEGYAGRIASFLLFALLQGAAIAAACMALGVQTASAPAFVFAVLATAFCFASIVFACSATFKHVGKALAALLLLVQIPMTVGLFPAQLMPDFFQAMASFMPFTYSMGAMREGIGGFFEYSYALDMTWLIACGVVAFFLAVIVRPGLLNLNRLFDRKLGYADVFIVDATAAGSAAVRSSAVDEIIQDYGACARMLSRVKNLSRRYNALRFIAPVLITLMVIALFVVPSLVALDAGAKLAMLGIFIGCLVVIAGICIAFEFGYDGLTSQLREAGVEATTMFADQNTAKAGGAHEKRD